MRPFGETIVLWRAHRQLSQAALARAARVTRANLAAIETGEREVTLGTLRSLAYALEVSAGELVEGTSPFGTQTKLSRPALERVAKAAATGTSLAHPELQRLAQCLRGVTTNLINSGAQRDAPTTALAYLQLKAMVDAATMASLVSRVQVYRIAP